MRKGRVYNTDFTRSEALIWIYNEAAQNALDDFEFSDFYDLYFNGLDMKPYKKWSDKALAIEIARIKGLTEGEFIRVGKSVVEGDS